MTPAEAGAFEHEEPDWQERFEEHCLRWPGLPRYLAEDSAFEATLRDWRQFHFTWIDVEVQGPNGPATERKQNPAPETDGVIALAQLKIFPPRFLIKDVPHGNGAGVQADDHMWLSVAGEQWRIKAIEDRMLHLERGYDDPKPQQMQIDLNRASWGNYVKAAAAVLEAQKSPPG